MISLALDTSASKQVAEAMLATEKQVQKATRRALKTVASTAEKAVKKQVADRTKISQKRLGARVKMRRYLEDEIVLWFGADSVDVGSLGKPQMNAHSTVVGRVVRRGAFFTTLGQSPRAQVFIREASEHLKENEYGDTRYGVNARKSRWGSIEGRFPLRRAVVNIDDEVKQAIDELDVDMQALFDKRMQAELNFEINVAGK